MRALLHSAFRTPHFMVLCLLALGIAWAGEIPNQTAASTSGTPSATANQLWAELIQNSQQLTNEPAWGTNRPTPQAYAQFRAQQGDMALRTAEKARTFFQQFPQHEKAAEARKLEYQMISLAVQRGQPQARARLDALDRERLQDTGLDPEERFQIRRRLLWQSLMSRSTAGLETLMTELEQGARALVQEFPHRPEPYEMLLQVAVNSEESKARSLAQEIAAGMAPEIIKTQAQALIQQMNLIGKPLALKFTALDGRKIDLAQLRGQVVLLAFWATWNGPSMAALPKLKQAYALLHPKGLEIIGISFDHNQAALTQVLDQEKLLWPQYFDGLGWQNKLGQKFGLDHLPALWLVDKQGLLRSLRVQGNLVQQVEKLLAEHR